uniref:Uncharacterized protein n=1 Tax=Parascaris univalens TaxID=6257 RepID=A0A915BBE7_PARUN
TIHMWTTFDPMRRSANKRKHPQSTLQLTYAPHLLGTTRRSEELTISLSELHFKSSHMLTLNLRWNCTPKRKMPLENVLILFSRNRHRYSSIQVDKMVINKKLDRYTVW